MEGIQVITIRAGIFLDIRCAMDCSKQFLHVNSFNTISQCFDIHCRITDENAEV